MKLSFSLSCILFLVNAGLFAVGVPTFDIQKSPEWKLKIPMEIPAKDFATSGDASYILLDWQENNLLHESNYRLVIRLNNEEGVQNNSQITFSFDPSYQQLAINKMIIHRGKSEINHLKRSEIELMRNEENADRLIYDGILFGCRYSEGCEGGRCAWNMNIQLKGKTRFYPVLLFVCQPVIQVGGVPDLPAYPGSGFGSIECESYSGRTITGSFGRRKNQSLIWDITNRPAIFTDANIPSWYNAYPACEISSFKDWKEVKLWGRNLFKLNIATPQLDVLILDRKFDKTDKGIVEAIRFVQDEIRYLGIETGINSHQPHQPEEVLKNRFGDCKDKSYLLVELLRKLGVEAWPAYVNSSNRGHVDDNAPSPFAFNHVIVKFRYHDVDYWVDPTINQQSGPLSLVCLPNYQKALVLDDKNTTFDEIPVSTSDRVSIRENLWFTDSTAEVKYEVESVYHGNPANSKRSYHLGTPIAEIRENYINFCSGYYKDLKWAGDSALKYTDYPQTNTFKVRESYVIPDFWGIAGPILWN